MVDTRLLREVVAGVLMVAGVIVIVAVAFLVDRLAGLAAIGVTMIVAGVLLGIERDHDAPLTPYDR